MDECTHFKLDCRDCLSKVYRADLTAEVDLELTRLRAELAEARALVEKRAAQIEWAADRGLHQVGDALTYSEARGGCVKVLAFDGTRAGLLAAIDEATKP